jgi:hypothetical protein
VAAQAFAVCLWHTFRFWVSILLNYEMIKLISGFPFLYDSNLCSRFVRCMLSLPSFKRVCCILFMVLDCCFHFSDWLAQSDGLSILAPTITWALPILTLLVSPQSLMLCINMVPALLVSAILSVGVYPFCVNILLEHSSSHWTRSFLFGISF